MEHGGGSKPSLGDKNKEERRRGEEGKILNSKAE